MATVSPTSYKNLLEAGWFFTPEEAIAEPKEKEPLNEVPKKVELGKEVTKEKVVENLTKVLKT